MLISSMDCFLKKYDVSFCILSLVTSVCLFVLSAVLYSARAVDISPLQLFAVSDSTLNLLNVTRSSGQHIFKANDKTDIPLLFDLTSHSSLDRVPPQSVTAILPILPGTLEKTQDLLEPFLYPLEHICEVVVTCPDAIVSDVRRMLQKAFSSLGLHDHPDVSLRPWKGYLDLSDASLRTAMDITADWILIMDDTGLNELPQYMRDILLSPPNMSLPFGPRGVPHPTDLSSTVSPLGRIRAATYVYPPFLVSSSVLSRLQNDVHEAPSSWDDLGRRISESRRDKVGGILINGYTAGTTTQLPSRLVEPHVDPGLMPLSDRELNAESSGSIGPYGQFVFMVPTRDDLRSVAPLICRMKSRYNEMRARVLVYSEVYKRVVHLESYSDWETEIFGTYRCDIEYDVLTSRGLLAFPQNRGTIISNWFVESTGTDVVVTLSEVDNLVAFLSSNEGKTIFPCATYIRIPRIDLPNTEWMSALSLEEWKSWHRPRIDISIITKDRPAALTRLLRSLYDSRYFGDQLSLRVNVEQDCDEESLRIAGNVTWEFGSVFIHHRVVHAGLLPAVVESWYPQDNDSYGLILEDDIEVSPLFYAWLKMTVLRYRYGDPSNRTPNMFGISLYQQKNLELPMKGRQAFNPRTLFAKLGMHHPHIPYLSAVPCSWGAIYFPEHWREFHDYLVHRLGETSLAIEDEIVPDVRSNYWSKSWKKFFIELVYLRGYVMLYPNYEDFVSLSTNHLEVGSHVKVRSPEKQEMFLLPLMQLHKPQESTKLLDLPHGQLPALDSLPILNLTGHITSLDVLIKQGRARREELLINCGSSDSYKERSLMCVSGT